MNAAEKNLGTAPLGLSTELRTEITEDLVKEARAKGFEGVITDDCPTDPEEWRKTFQEYIDNTPQEGDLLKTADCSPAKLNIELTGGQPPFIYARAYVPTQVGCKLGWFLQSIDSISNYGWKIIIMPRSREQIIKRLGIRTNTVQVQSILIIRSTVSGRALLGEVHEW